MIDFFRISKRIFCNFFIENNNPEFEKLMTHLQNELYVKSERECFEKWLNSDFVVDFFEKKIQVSSSVNFQELSIATKRRKLILIEVSYSNVEIGEAFFWMLQTNEKWKLANIIKIILKKNDKESNNVENCDEQSYTPYSAEEALASIEDVKWPFKCQYEIIRTQVKERNANIYSA